MQFAFGDTVISLGVPTRADMMEEVRRRLNAGDGFALATLNLDHIAKMRASPDFVRIYAGQDLVVADGWPVVALSRIARHPVELIPGSDMIVPLCELAVKTGSAVALVGSTDDALQAAAETLRRDVPGLNIVFTHAPPMGFDPESADAAAVCKRLSDAGVTLCFLGLGAPRQEALAIRGRILAPGVGFASIGAGLDFLAGTQRRAPRWIRRIGMEWLWRTASNPRRFIPRYAACIAILPGRFMEALNLRRARR